jgi:hypothetical protein
MDRYLQANEVDGVTMDWRYQVSPSEEIRQTVVCQLLAYIELYRLTGMARIRTDIVEHADFMIGRLADIRSYTPFDGMLAYALLGAYETTQEARFLTVGTQVTQDMLAIPTSQCLMNGGLMVAMATAEFAHLTGDAGADQKTRDIIAQLAPYQNADGSFPHWCVGSRDIHYTGWMSMEMVHLERMMADDTLIAPMLARATSFLEGRIAPDGRSVYEEPCPGQPGCTNYYYSRASGCSYDYDTRGWTVEPVYCALAFDHAGSPQYGPVMEFTLSLETGGTFPDLYAYWPPPSDPEYPWTIADTSVVNMSIIFWALATEVSDRVARGIPVDLVLDNTGVPVPPPVALPLAIAPNPARGACVLSFSLAQPAEVTLAVYDAAGRRVRVLESGAAPAGPSARSWDGRDDGGRSMPGGVYFARFGLGGRTQTKRFVLIH